MIRRLYCEEEGQVLVEYSLIVVLISIIAVTILTIGGRKGRDVYVTICERMVTTSQ
jgi:Flp pilus assembly pilin Flp